MRILVVLFSLLACQCSGGQGTGSLVRNPGDRGDTNGRMFDFVSDKPDGDDWQIRVRGNSLWASYSLDQKSDQFGPKALPPDQTKALWRLIDRLDITERKKGVRDEDNGTVSLQLREPEKDKHKIFTVYVSRATEDEDVLALGNYLRKLIAQHFRETPNF